MPILYPHMFEGPISEQQIMLVQRLRAVEPRLLLNAMHRWHEDPPDHFDLWAASHLPQGVLQTTFTMHTGILSSTSAA